MVKQRVVDTKHVVFLRTDKYINSLNNVKLGAVQSNSTYLDTLYYLIW